MYHDITAAPVTGGGGPQRFAVPVGEFRRQLDQLAASGFSGRSLREARHARDARTLGITFDDGETGQYERGFRSLAERGMTATFFVTTDWIGTPGFVTWDQLREMRAAGMEVQSHARTHTLLSELDADALAAELRHAKDVLDQGLGQDTDTLALPGGAWPRRPLRGLIQEAGYRVVATSAWGRNAPAGSGGPVRVRRCTVAGVEGAQRFGQIIAGDAWLGGRRWVRESALGALRSVMGADRYAAWRRALLDRVR